MKSTLDDYKRVNHITGQPNFNTPPELPNKGSMNLLIWNCRGVGKNTFKRNMRDLIRNHKPYMIILMETKVTFSSMGTFFNNLGFTASSNVDLNGRAGGIWLLWEPSQVSIIVFEANHQVIHATINRVDYEEWVPSTVYASPNPRNRDALWEGIEAISEDIQSPWLVAVDFNDFANQGERRSFIPNTNTSRNSKFLEKLSNFNLMGMGCSGPKLTWTNNRQGLANTKEKLDRALFNTQWMNAFPESCVWNLPQTYSNHASLVVYI
ncbi:uncharacterized protein LOC114313424 [Camellia sinensis]|uniref:uncharacterized protein LOC114313424 n=1 Tax=Camellia sinensis TaxID=4442 RepID=UPI0010357402|nr:uncharacterized protein LOC114313424 [Camellia sinensis]